MSNSFNVVYRKRNYRIYDVGSEYVIHNASYDFDSYHTHISNFKTCKYIIDLCIHKTVPYHLSDYLLISILRISDDEEYKSKIHKVLKDNENRRRLPYNYYIKNNKKGNRNVKRENINKKYSK